MLNCEAQVAVATCDGDISRAKRKIRKKEVIGEKVIEQASFADLYLIIWCVHYGYRFSCLEEDRCGFNSVS